jgi:hypothetical protein
MREDLAPHEIHKPMPSNKCVSSLDIRDPRELHLIDSGSNDKLYSALAGALARLPSRQGTNPHFPALRSGGTPKNPCNCVGVIDW